MVSGYDQNLCADAAKKKQGLRYLLAETKSELLVYQKDIIDLFSNTFARLLAPEIWKWLYIENPCGEPIVALCYDENILVGHFAIVPIFLEIDQQLIKAAVTYTTMVAEKYRSRGVFYNLVKILFAKLKFENYDLVFGFPNRNSMPVMQGYFSWNINKSYIARLKKKQIQELYDNSYNTHVLKLDISDNVYLKWRLAKPGVNYFTDSGNIFKYYNNDLELVYYTENSIEKLDDALTYKVLVDAEYDRFISYKMLDYCFGYQLFNNNLNILSIKKDLLMSDVF